MEGEENGRGRGGGEESRGREGEGWKVGGVEEGGRRIERNEKSGKEGKRKTREYTCITWQGRNSGS